MPKYTSITSLDLVSNTVLIMTRTMSVCGRDHSHCKSSLIHLTNADWAPGGGCRTQTKWTSLSCCEWDCTGSSSTVIVHCYSTSKLMLISPFCCLDRQRVESSRWTEPCCCCYPPAWCGEARWCFQRRLFVCLCVCLSVCLCVCTITSERLNIGRSNLAVRYIVQKSRPSSKVKVKGEGHQGQKNEKNCWVIPIDSV